MESSMKLLMLSASVLISCTIIALWFTLSDQIGKYSDKKQMEIEAYHEREKQELLSGYNGMTIYGYEICRYIRKLLDKELYPELVVTMISGEVISIDICNDYYLITNSGSEKYIEPVSLYKCAVSIHRNADKESANSDNKESDMERYKDNNAGNIKSINTDNSRSNNYYSDYVISFVEVNV
ncbi:MAG: hypothetical protein MJ113_02235 [Lachnospiraceae bacterium]|nr:hypothetical protein [Lachnospiraceae bacterium]